MSTEKTPEDIIVAAPQTGPVLDANTVLQRVLENQERATKANSEITTQLAELNGEVRSVSMRMERVERKMDQVSEEIEGSKDMPSLPWRVKQIEQRLENQDRLEAKVKELSDWKKEKDQDQRTAKDALISKGVTSAFDWVIKLLAAGALAWLALNQGSCAF